MDSSVRDSPLTFVVRRVELEKRIDVSYYRPRFREYYEMLKKSPFRRATLGEVSEKIFSGMTPLSGGPEYTTSAEGVPFIRSGDINENDKIEFDSALYIRREVHVGKMRSSILRKNDLLLAIVGATIGRVAVYRYDREANINQAIAGVRLKKGASPDYVKWFLLTKHGQTQLSRLKRPVARANINLQEVASIEVLLPPFGIQDEIVKIATEALKKGEEMRGENERLVASLDGYLLDALRITMPQFVERTPLSYEAMAAPLKGERWDVAFWKPEYRAIDEAIRERNGYPVIQLGTLLEQILNGLDYRIFADEGIKYLRVGNIRPFEIDDVDVKHVDVSLASFKDAVPRAGDILFTRKGTFGVAVLVERDLDSLISSEIFRLILRASEEINPFYLVAVMNSSIGKKQSLRMSVGAIMGSLSQEAAKSILIPLPPKRTQDRIVHEVRSRLAEARRLRENSKRVLEEAKALIEKMIFGG